MRNIPYYTFSFAFHLFHFKMGKCKGENLVRNTESGQIKGELRSNKFNQEENYYAFHAIPYGKPPINSDRFQRPQPAESWTEVLDASDSNEYKCCYQVCVT